MVAAVELWWPTQITQVALVFVAKSSFELKIVPVERTREKTDWFTTGRVSETGFHRGNTFLWLISNNSLGLKDHCPGSMSLFDLVRTAVEHKRPGKTPEEIAVESI